MTSAEHSQPSSPFRRPPTEPRADGVSTGRDVDAMFRAAQARNVRRTLSDPRAAALVDRMTGRTTREELPDPCAVDDSTAGRAALRAARARLNRQIMADRHGIELDGDDGRPGGAA